MDALTIAAGAGLRSRIEALDLLAHDIANAQTTGFKASRELSRRYTAEEAFAVNTNDHGPGSAPDIDDHWTDFSQGPLAVTGNPLDVALEGRGFFTVEAGAGRRLLTRDGHFRLSAEGRLETNDGLPVLVIPPDKKEPEPLRVSRTAALDIDREGVIRVRDGAAEPRVAGRLWIVSPREPRLAAKLSGNYFSFELGLAESAGARAEVHQGKLEGANVNAAETSVRLVAVMRQFETLNRALQLGGEMSKRVVEEVARVG